MLQAFALDAALDDVTSLFFIASAAFTSGLLLVPSAVFSFRRITGRANPTIPVFASGLNASLLIFALPPVILLGYLVTTQTDLSWLLLPALHTLAVLISVFWLLYLGVRGLPLGTPQRTWGIFGSGLVLGPFLILLLEILAMIFFGIIGLIYLSSQPELIEQILTFSEQIVSGPVSAEEVTELLAPYITQPAVVFAVVAFTALVVPLIEEALKPIGVWLLIWRDITPAEGFAAGAVSGAGFAMFESLAASTIGEEWAILVTARIGTAIVHILTTGLMGWALAATWRDKKYLRLGTTYIGVVLLHGFWNGMTIFFTADSLAKDLGIGSQIELVSILGPAAPYILGVLTLVLFVALLGANRHFRRVESSDSA
jgi:hypothetical protein